LEKRLSVVGSADPFQNHCGMLFFCQTVKNNQISRKSMKIPIFAFEIMYMTKIISFLLWVFRKGVRAGALLQVFLSENTVFPLLKPYNG